MPIALTTTSAVAAESNFGSDANRFDKQSRHCTMMTKGLPANHLPHPNALQTPVLALTVEGVAKRRHPPH